MQIENHKEEVPFAHYEELFRKADPAEIAARLSHVRWDGKEYFLTLLGREYAVSEMTAPVRMVTSFVKTSEGICIPVKTASPIPKEKIFDCMADIKSVVAHLPVKVGDVMISDVAGTGIDVIATRSVGGFITDRSVS